MMFPVPLGATSCVLVVDDYVYKGEVPPVEKPKHRFQIVRGSGQSSATPPHARPPVSTAEKPGAGPQPQSMGRGLTVGDLQLLVRSAESRLATLIDDRHRVGNRLQQIVMRSIDEIDRSLRTAQQRDERDPDKTRGSLDQAVDSMARLLGDIQEISLSLTSDTVEAFDLASELTALVNSYQQTHSLQVKLELAPAAIDILTREEAHAVLALVKDSLLSSVRYARATSAEVKLHQQGARLRLVIYDNGGRFWVEGKPFMGAELMRTAGLVRGLGWKVRAYRRHCHGTQITAVLPLEPMFSEG